MKATAIIGIIVAGVSLLVISVAANNIVTEGAGGLGWGFIAGAYLLVFCIVELVSDKKQLEK